MAGLTFSRAAIASIVAVALTGGLVAESTGVRQAGQTKAQPIPAHPRDLKFGPLDYTPPESSKHRHVIAGVAPAYLVEDHDLPLVTVTVHIRGGSYLEPKGKEGLAALTGGQMRAGGTAAMSAEQFDEEVEVLAANISSGLGPTSGTASVNFLAKEMDRALQLFFDMLKAPRFQTDRLDLARSQALQAMERRNDSTEDIEEREWLRLIRGPDHFASRRSTKASIDSISREDLAAFHQQIVHPGAFVISAAGDFETADLKARLERVLGAWPAKAAPPPPPAPTHMPAPGVYVVNKPDVNQGRVSIGHVGHRRGDPDEVAIEMMNDILGGSGFTSRITNRVRSDEGLAYSAGSSAAPGVYYEGQFVASFQSKSATVAQAAQIVIDEIERMRNEKPSADELTTVKNYAVEVFPRYFSSASAIASTFANDELTGRDPAYWKTYRERVRAVTADDIQRVARRYLQPDKLVILAVGAVDDMLKGNPDKPQYSIEKLAKGRPITRIPLPDPLTMTYPTQ
jgi:predicted Zn-dependent peptidase